MNTPPTTDGCTAPEVTASELNCTALTVELRGKVDKYLIQYRPEDTTEWSEKSVELSSSPGSFIITGTVGGEGVVGLHYLTLSCRIDGWYKVRGQSQMQ